MSAVVVTSPTPRRVRAPKWLDLRLVAGVVLVLASVLLGARVISRANASDSVWAASRDLAPGTVLSADDLVEVHDEPGLPGCTVSGAQDWQLHGFLAQLSRGGRSSFGSLVAAAPDRMPARITAPSNASAVMTRPASGAGTRITTP